MAIFASTELAARVEAAEVQLLTAGAEAIAAQRPAADVWLRPVAGGVACYTVPGSPLNKLAGVGFGGLAAAEELAAVERVFAGRGAPLQAELSTLAQREWFDLLAERGYRLAGFEAVLGRRLEELDAPVLPEGVEITPIEAAERERWLPITMSGFSTPDTQGVASHERFETEALAGVVRDMAYADGLRQYLARRNGAPAAVSAMRLTDGIAQLCGATVLPEHRRNGIHTALLARRLHDARAAGCDLAIMIAQPGSRSMQNAFGRGFELLYKRAMLVKS